ncbi:4-hydroxy-3-methylbut-2-enyl diphosphate reductase [Candidatus Pacearchaeota archaeon]|nr:MAG: 4-hydroxy-3-methylbut-2-enyl diphosphate reductase [Candidatus Pacearchaeota archaeon]
MKIKIAKKAGFCMGVRRAVNLVLKALSRGEKPIYTYGPLIHNPQTLKLLEKLGVKIIRDVDENVPSGSCILRAHGIPPQEKEKLSKRHKIIDGTCPRVLKVQALAKKAVKRGADVIIIGDKDHAEVKGILGFCKDKGYIVSNFEDIEKLPELKDYVILSQTTQDKNLFEKLSQKILSKYPSGEVINTICNATHLRQEEVRKLCNECQVIIVIGGKFSANTNRLAQIARNEGKEVYLVETADEIPLEKIKKYKKIGITAGASTPNWLINEVVDKLKSTSIFYVILKVFSFLCFVPILSFLLYFLGFSNFANFNISNFFLFFLFSFLFFKYNFFQLKTKDSLEFFYSLKNKFLNNHKWLINFLLIISGILVILSSLFIDLKLFSLFIIFIFLDFFLLKSSFYFISEILFFIILVFYFLGFNNLLLLMEIIAFLIFMRLYLELVYLETDGFLPKNFLISLCSFREDTIYKVLNIIIISGILLSFVLCFKNIFYIFLVLIWGWGYCLIKFLKKRPLGQIVYLENLSLTFPLLFFIFSLIYKIWK